MENYENPQIDEMIEEEPEVEEEKHPLQSLLDYFKESLEEEDEKGFAEVYRTSTERFFKDLAEKLSNDKISFTPCDIEYGDGYFIFAFGTNSVVHFHVKEAPGWLFGIWWKPVELCETREAGTKPNYHNDRIHCDFFAQYEEDIDKFKPSYSTFAESFIWWLDASSNSNYSALCEGESVVRLILTEPMLAWYREKYYVDLNVEYVSREQAEAAFQEEQLYKANCKLIDRENLQKMLDCVNYIFKPLIDSGQAFICDRGKCISPRYEVIIHNYWKDENNQEDSEDGDYPMFDWCKYKDLEEDKALFEKTEKECKERASAAKHYWFNPVSHWVCILSNPRFTELKDKQKEE